MSDKLRFGEILVRAGVLDRETLDRVLREIGDSPADLGEVLVTRKLVDESTMLHAVGKALNLPSVSVEQATPDPRALQLVPRQLCAEYFLLPIEVERSRMGEHLHVAMANPADVRAIKQVTRQSRLRIRPLVASAREIRVAIARCYGEEAAPVAAEPAPSPPEIPVAPPSRASGAGTDHIFDFDVTDLSAYHDDPPTTPGGTNPELRAAPSGVDLSVGLPPAGLTSRHSTPALGSATSRHSTGSLNPVASRHSTPSLSVPNKTPPPPASSRTSRPPMGPLDAPAPRTLAVPPPSPSRSAMRRGIDADLADALDHSPMDSVVGNGDLFATPSRPSEGFGFGRRTRTNASVDLPPRAAPAAGPPPAAARVNLAGRPLPPLPPGLSTRMRRPERTTNRPEPRHRASAPPAEMPTSRHAGQVGVDEQALPSDLIDDQDRFDVRSLLDRFVTDQDEGDGAADEVLAHFLERYGPTRSGAEDATFLALDEAIGRAGSGTARLLLALVRHLARRGLVDPVELLSELRKA